MKNTLFFFVLLFLISCGKKQADTGCHTMVCEASEFSLSTTDSGPIPPEALLFETSLKLVNFDLSDKEKVERAADLVKRVIRSQEFKDAIIGYEYNGENEFVDNNGLTNLQIYERIINAAEKFFPEKNYVLNVELQLYYEDTNTIGYTYPDSTRIWMNTKYFDRYTPYQVAGNLTHEWIHKLGFTHDVASTPERPYSVPYAVGYMVRELAADLFPNLY